MARDLPEPRVDAHRSPPRHRAVPGPRPAADDMSLPAAADRYRHDLSELVVRVTFGMIWAADASLKWQPGFRNMFLANLRQAAAGQPGWLAPWFSFWIQLEGHAPAFFGYAAAVTETGLAIVVLLGVARKAVYLSGAGYALLVWSTAGGFGGPYLPGSTDIGPAIMYAVIFGALLALGGLTGRFCLDTVIARRVGWWWRVAGRGYRYQKPSIR